MTFQAVDLEHYARTVVGYYGLSDIVIRPARKSDFQRLTEIQVSALCASGRDLYGAVKIKRFVERHLKQTLALCGQSTFYVASDSREVLGCGGWTLAKVDGRNEIPCAVNFYVDRRHSESGIGRSLLTITETSARKSGVTSLAAFVPIHSADLFREAGYAANDIVPFDLGDHHSIDLLVMRKRLSA